MRKKFSGIVLVFLCAVLTACAAQRCFAAGSDVTVYTNGSTNYRAVISDEADLLTAAEEESLVSRLIPLTEYANIAVYTVSTPSSANDVDRARNKRIDLFGAKNSAVFMIDMSKRRIVIQRKGNMENYLNNEQANAITDNAARYAKQGNYQKACTVALDQIKSVIIGEKFAMPMKYLNNGSIALMIGLITAFAIASATSSTYKKEYDYFEYLSENFKPTWNEVKKSTKKRKNNRSGYGGSSCGGSSCGGSSCGGSSCGGSSCGGSSCGGSSCGGSSF